MMEKSAGGDNNTRSDHDLRALSRALRSKGVVVRREKLVRGNAFRARSGPCTFLGQRVLFLDRTLPSDQQLSLLLEFVRDRGLVFEAHELVGLSPERRNFFQNA